MFAKTCFACVCKIWPIAKFDLFEKKFLFITKVLSGFTRKKENSPEGNQKKKKKESSMWPCYSAGAKRITLNNNLVYFT